MKKCDSAITEREAVEIVRNCPRDRLPYVLAILRQSGFDFPDAAVELARTTRQSKTDRMAYKRKQERRNWLETDDPSVKMLREAYDTGISFTDVSKLSGINRTVLYSYLKGELNIAEKNRRALNDTLEMIFEEKKKLKKEV